MIRTASSLLLEICLLTVLFQTAWGGPAEGPRSTLRALVDAACKVDPGVRAAAARRDAVAAQRTHAKWGWAPTGDLKAFVGPSPEIRCFDATGAPSEQQCVRTNRKEINAFDAGGVHAFVELNLRLPLYTFEKIASLRRMAGAGVAAREAQVWGSLGDVAVTTTNAYWSWKFSRHLLAILDHADALVADALEAMESDVAEGSGDTTMTDVLRLKTSQAELTTARAAVVQTQKTVEALLATVTAQPLDQLNLNDNVPDLVDQSPAEIQTYIDRARSSRPETRAMSSAIDVKRAESDFTYAQLWPDFVLVGTFGYGYASSVDDPQHAFYRDPYNFGRAGGGIGVRWKTDPVKQVNAYEKSQAELAEVDARRREVAIGVELEIRQHHAELSAARRRWVALDESAADVRKWLDETVAEFKAGKKSATELNDAVFAYYQNARGRLEAALAGNVAWTRLARAAGDITTKDADACYR